MFDLLLENLINYTIIIKFAFKSSVIAVALPQPKNMHMHKKTIYIYKRFYFFLAKAKSWPLVTLISTPLHLLHGIPLSKNSLHFITTVHISCRFYNDENAMWLRLVMWLHYYLANLYIFYRFTCYYEGSTKWILPVLQ